MDNVFTQAKALIARRGWSKGAGQTQDGRICLALALERVGFREASMTRVTQYPAIRALFTAIRTYQPDGLPRYGRVAMTADGQPASIPSWNDHPNTTLDDVNAVLDIAAKQWDADHPSD